MGFNNWACFGCSADNPNRGDVGPPEGLFLAQDAGLFASWGVDYVKPRRLQHAGRRQQPRRLLREPRRVRQRAQEQRRPPRHRLLRVRPAYFPIGPTGLGPWRSDLEAPTSSGLLWRSGYDVKTAHAAGSAWNKTGNQAGVLTQYAYNTDLVRSSGPGNRNDPDFLIPDQLSTAETRSQTALYAVTSSPLILSTDVTALSGAELSAPERAVTSTRTRSAPEQRGRATARQRDHRHRTGGRTALRRQPRRHRRPRQRDAEDHPERLVHPAHAHQSDLRQPTGISNSPVCLERYATTACATPVDLADCATCPDGKLVGFLGGSCSRTGTLAFTDVQVATPGTYRLQIGYVNGGSTARTDHLAVNGGPAAPIVLAGNGSWTTLQSALVAVSLHTRTSNRHRQPHRLGSLHLHPNHLTRATTAVPFRPQ
ncbi:hypothetical protein [Kitasatospora cineracea]|uniref:Alpha galactosidase A n=1 Tax=Kitasatospora cineracea TaxID=88074 RepID=A0A8G1URB5_9ACTN|nr:hypothetical protein [Kitasatospora cineracea]ROR46389.1 alpha galactosidase A [Kitasatospora cineracea]